MKKLLIILILCLPLVYAASEEARDAYFNASLDVEYMKSANLPVESLEDALVGMKEALQGENISKLREKADILNASGEADKVLLAQALYGEINASLKTGINPGVNYSFVIEKAAWIRQMREKAVAASDAIASMKKVISEINDTAVNLSSVEATMAQAEKTFSAEWYDDIPAMMERAEAQLEDAQVQAAREHAFLRLARRNAVDYVIDHWFGLLLTLAVLCALGTWTFFEVRYNNARMKVQKLKLELSANEETQKNTQEQYYKNGMGSGSYRARMELLKHNQRKMRTNLQVWEKLAESYKNRSLLVRFRQ